jgi:hypothetical protein
MRKLLPLVTVLACLLVPGVAAATSFTASAGGVSATLSYQDGPGITTKHEQLRITAPGMGTYDAPVPARGCFKVCSPVGTQKPVQVLDLYGDGEEAVVLNLFTGGASCCGLEQVYVPSAAVHSWVLTTHNFGQDGTKIVREAGTYVFLSGDTAFSCEFTACVASGMPLQVFSFTGDAFHNVTTRYPALIRADASSFLKTFYREPKQGLGVIAPWAADEDELGLQATVSTVLQRQVADGNLTAKFVEQLQAFLRKHGYTH